MRTIRIGFTSNKYLAFLAILVTNMMGVLDGTIMNVALPFFSQQFQVAPSDTIWIVNGYQLVITMTLLAFSALGDVYGYRRIFLCGISLFSASSFLCACSTSLEMLVTARMLQGVGAACTMSVNTALIRLIFPPIRLGRAMALNSVLVAASAASGPTISGMILSFAHWHWLFLLNVPLGIAACFLGWRWLPSNPLSEVEHRFDMVSALANAFLFGLIFYTLEGVSQNWSFVLLAVQILLILGGSIWYIKRLKHQPTPILPIDLLKIPIFRLSILSSIASLTAQMLAMVSIPFFMQNQLGYSAVEIGLLLTPWPLATILAAPLAGRLTEKVHPGILGSLGMCVLAVGLFLLYLLPSVPEKWDICWRMAICGLGFGMFQIPNNVTIAVSGPLHRSGGAGGMLGTARLLGQTFGTFLVALLFKWFTEVDGAPVCLLLASAFAILAAIFSAKRLSHLSPIKHAAH